jgi:hypothetical protein
MRLGWVRASRLLFAGALALTVGAISPFERLLAPPADLWARWERHQPAATAAVDHGAWDRLLARHAERAADGVVRVAYGEFGDEDRALLEQYLAALAAVPVSQLSRNEQLPFWLNLYNALTVKVVVDYYLVASIRDIDISSGLFARGPWGRKLITVEGEALSLNDIEHRILRPIWRDPRIHYGVNCAAVGCPNLQLAAFTAANADAMLATAAAAFVNDPRGVRIAEGQLIVSSIYVWFRDDFADDDAGVIAHLRRYAAPELAAALAGMSSIAGHAYDWTLNDLRRGR